MDYKYTLENYPAEVKYDNSRRKEIERCPFCGKSNRDGKFVPYVGFKDRGHCHSCGKYSPLGKNQCPKCKEENAFNRYIEKSTGKYVNDHVGLCLYCGYHLPPREYLENKQKPLVPINTKAPSYIPQDIFKSSLTAYSQNNFISWLRGRFDNETVDGAIKRYHIGTSKNWPGAVVFWQIDSHGNVRAGKIMQYNAQTGKRVKKPKSLITWTHTVMKLKEYNLTQCLYGEHLLKENSKPVALVESEKTAIVGSIYLPELLWLSTGGIENLTANKCKVLTGRKVILYPDTNGYDKWKDKANQISFSIPDAHFVVSDLLEKNSTDEEKKNGLDLCDYLIKYPVSSFQTLREKKQETQIKHMPQQNITVFTQESTISTPEDIRERQNDQSENEANPVQKLEGIEHPDNWDIEIADLEDFFSEIALPIEVVKLNNWTTITDVANSIVSHFDVVKAHNGNLTFLPYLNRLIELKQLLITNLKSHENNLSL